MDSVAQVFEANFPGVAVPTDLAALLPTRRLAAGRSLFVQGQPVTAFYAVLRGEIEARLTGWDGGSSVLEHIGPPRVFGLAAFAAGEPAGYEAVAVRASELLVFGPEAYRRLMDEVPGFARALLAELARRFDGNLRLLHAVRHQDAEERVLLALRRLRVERGGTVSSGGWLELRATQREIGELARLSRQTVNQVLARLQAAGHLRLGRATLSWPAGGVLDGEPAARPRAGHAPPGPPSAS